MKPLGVLVACGIAAAAIVVAAQTGGVAQRYTAAAVNTTSGGTGTVDLVVNRWSTDAERTRLMTTLLDKGLQSVRRQRAK